MNGDRFADLTDEELVSSTRAMLEPYEAKVRRLAALVDQMRDQGHEPAASILLALAGAREVVACVRGVLDDA